MKKTLLGVALAIQAVNVWAAAPDVPDKKQCEITYLELSRDLSANQMDAVLDFAAENSFDMALAYATGKRSYFGELGAKLGRNSFLDDLDRAKEKMTPEIESKWREAFREEGVFRKQTAFLANTPYPGKVSYLALCGLKNIYESESLFYSDTLLLESRRQ